MASSPLGLRRLNDSPPIPANPRFNPGSLTVSSEFVEEAFTLLEAVIAPGPGRISGSVSLAVEWDPGLMAEEVGILALCGLVGVVGLVNPRLASASRVPSGSTITLIT